MSSRHEFSFDSVTRHRVPVTLIVRGNSHCVDDIRRGGNLPAKQTQYVEGGTPWFS